MPEKYPQYIENYPIENISLNDWNPNKMDEGKFKSLIRSIKERKFLVPIVINKDGVVVDGEHRYLASKECKLENVPVIQVDMTVDEMKLSTLGLNGIRGENVPLEFAKLLQDLNQRYSLEEISEFIGFRAEDIKDKLELLKIPEDLIKQLREESNVREQTLPVMVNFVLNKEQAEKFFATLEKVEGTNRGEKLMVLREAYERVKEQNRNN